MAEAAALAVAPSMMAKPAKSARPNIIYIMCDDMGYGDLDAMVSHTSARRT